MALPRLFAGAAALAVAAALVWAGAATAGPLDISVTGSASGTLPGDRFPFWANHPVRLSIDAHAGHGQATGAWQAVHTELDGSLHAAFGGTIDTLDAAGSLAILNGVLTWKDNPANPTLPMVG